MYLNELAKKIQQYRKKIGKAIVKKTVIKLSNKLSNNGMFKISPRVYE